MIIFKSTELLRKYLMFQRETRSLRSIQREDFPLAKVGTLSRIINDPYYDPYHLRIRKQLRLSGACPPRYPRKQRAEKPPLTEHEKRVKKLIRGMRAETAQAIKDGFNG